MNKSKLFRVWDVKGKTFLNNWQFAITGNGSLLLKHFPGQLKTWRTFHISEKYPEYIIEQYTGQKDNLQKMIFEGDIVKFGNWVNPVGSSYETQYGKIIYEYGAFWVEYNSKWSDNNPKKQLLSDFYWTLETHYVSNIGETRDRSEKPRNDIEKIGNIHENPELIGGGQ